jgi:hypothetical protein
LITVTLCLSMLAEELPYMSWHRTVLIQTRPRRTNNKPVPNGPYAYRYALYELAPDRRARAETRPNIVPVR